MSLKGQGSDLLGNGAQQRVGAGRGEVVVLEVQPPQPGPLPHLTTINI